MTKFRYVLLAVVAGICFTVAAPKTQAQVSVAVNIGPAPDCPYGYYDYAPYACAPTATTARNGSPAAYSSAPARGFTAPTISKAT
jgi:hypothetical protein